MQDDELLYVNVEKPSHVETRYYDINDVLSCFMSVSVVTHNPSTSTAMDVRPSTSTATDVRPSTSTATDVRPSCSDVEPAVKRVTKTTDVVHCSACLVDVPRYAYQGHLRSNRHKANVTVAVDEGVEIIRTAFKQRLISYRVSPKIHHIDVRVFMQDNKPKIIKMLRVQLQKYTSIKANVELFGIYFLETKMLTNIKSFQTKFDILGIGSNLHEYVEKITNIFDVKQSEFQQKDSGWSLVRFLYVEVNVVKFAPMQGSAYVKVPLSIARKHAVVNVENYDEYCFAYAIMSALIPPNGKPQRVQSYPDFRDIFDWSDIEFPVKVSSISEFETKNRISVNVYGLEDVYRDGKRLTEVVGPLYYTKGKQPSHVNLLLVSDDMGNEHYVWIKNCLRLLSSQLNQHNGAKFFCDSCLYYFRTREQLTRHVEHDCNYVYTKLPQLEWKTDKAGAAYLDNQLTFRNYTKQMTLPFVIYADFEALIVPLDTVDHNPETAFTIKTCKHEPYAFCYYIKSMENDEWSSLELYRGENAAGEFVRRLQNDIKRIYRTHLKNVVPMLPLSDREAREYEERANCYICNKPFSDVDDQHRKVRDHSHITGKYRGAAHSLCNLHFQIPSFIPIFFHNLSGYDVHMFVKHLANENEQIDILPINSEKYITFGKKILVDHTRERTYLQLRFIDSFKFMAASLDALSQNLSDEQCVEVRKFYGNGEGFRLLRKKGHFPYSYGDSVAKLNDVTIPSREKFYDAVRGQNISEQDYERVVRVWTHFKCTTLGEYADVYLKSDVLLLADVFENFRSLCMQVYGLEPAQYVTTLGLAWDAMLKCTGVQLELLTDIDMYHFFKKGIRGGVSMCVKRKSIANNEFVSHFDPSKPKSFIQYLDATNLYGWSQYLPQGGFCWLTDEEIERFDVLQIDDESDVGYVLEVDMHYPTYLHDQHTDFPFCPETIQPPNTTTEKLIPNSCDKTNYVIHYRYLKQCVRHGLVVTRIHRLLRFRQSPWLMKYIDLNTSMRNKAKNKFENGFFKFMVNGVFGKTMENVDKRRLIKLVTHWENNGRRVGLARYVTKPNFKNYIQFTDKLFAVEMSKQMVTYDKPVYVGFAILDLSKIVMYRFFYDILRREYGKNVSLLYTDTDSLIVEINANDIYQHMRNNLDEYDTSNYEGNLHGIPTNVSVVGKMKDEFAGKAIESFYGAGSKSYCVRLANDHLIKKAKGVKKVVIQQVLNESNFKHVAEGFDKTVMCKMLVFRSTLHDVYTELVNKIAFRSQDNKRFRIPDTCSTLAWGHWRIPELQSTDLVPLSILLKVAKDMNMVRDTDVVTDEHETD